MAGDHAFQLEIVLAGGCGTAHNIVILGRDGTIAAGHVLPDEQAEAVAVPVKTARFDLDMLAQHVEAHPLEHLKIIDHGLLGRRRVDAVGPEALVERTGLKEGLAVEKEPGHTRLVRTDGNGAEAEIAFNLVDHLAAAQELDCKVVEVGRGRRPEPGPGNGQPEGGIGGAAPGSDHPGLLECSDGKALMGPCAGDAAGHSDSAGGGIGNNAQLLDAGHRHRLDPHRPPDARAGGVKDAAGLEHLLAARLGAGIGRIPDRDGDHLFAGVFKGGGDIKGKRVVAAFMIADLNAVDPDLGLPVHRLKMKEDPLLAPTGGNGKSAAVPETLLR